MITCDRGGRRLASAGYKYGTVRALPAHLSLLPSPPQFLLRLGVMATIRRFSAAEKGKAPQEVPDPLPPKKRPALRGRDEEDRLAVLRPWYERPPPGFPLPLYAHAEGSGRGDADPLGQRRRRRRRITKVLVVPPGVHAEGSSRELVLPAAMPPRTWILLPPFFAFAFQQVRLLELWLPHADCSTPATGAEVAITASGEVFMTRGWGEIARCCRTKGALTIHLEYDGASVMFFKVFDANGHRLECCPGGGGQDPATATPGPANRPRTAPQATGAPEDPAIPVRSSRRRRRATTATSPRADAAPGAGQARLVSVDPDLDGVGAGACRPTVDDGIFCRGACN